MCCPVSAISGFLPCCGHCLLAPLTENEKGSIALKILRAAAGGAADGSPPERRAIYGRSRMHYALNNSSHCFTLRICKTRWLSISGNIPVGGRYQEKVLDTAGKVQTKLVPLVKTQKELINWPRLVNRKPQVLPFLGFVGSM